MIIALILIATIWALALLLIVSLCLTAGLGDGRSALRPTMPAGEAPPPATRPSQQATQEEAGAWPAAA
jgi:hypothetical protein